MGQVTLFFLFITALIVGAFAYFYPKQQDISPLKITLGSGGYDTADGADTSDDTNTIKSQQLSVTTNGGDVQIHRQIDDLTQEQKHLMGMIDYGQQVLDSINKEIADITKQAGGENVVAAFKLKILGLRLNNEQRLLAAYGRQLTGLNAQLNKNRQLLAEERDLVNAATNDQSAMFFNNVKDQIDEERQRAHDQQNR